MTAYGGRAEVTINELIRLTRIDLCDLAQRITNELPKFAAGSPERASALSSALAWFPPSFSASANRGLLAEAGAVHRLRPERRG